MGEPTVNLGKIAESVRPGVRRLVETISQVAGQGGRGLTVYGPAIADGFDEARDTVSSVLVLDAVDLGLLRRLASEGVRLGRERIAAPLIMTPTYIAESCDTFPLELLEIHQNHLTLFGEDFFGELSFQSTHMRLQCEREFKRILIRLRQGILAAAGRERMLADLETDIGVHLLRTLRGFLWIKDQREFLPASAVVAAVEKLADRQLPSSRQAILATFDRGWSAYESLYGEVEALARWANDA